jgi:hypothetical protein
MNEESKYRVEETDEGDRDEAVKGFLSPLPEPIKRSHHKGSQPIVKFFGLEMRESRRDWIVLLIMPMMAGIIDASLYALVIVDLLSDDIFYMFVIPLLVAIPIGLTVEYASKALLGGILSVVFFIIFLMLFLISPGFFAADLSPLDYAFTSLVFLAIYSLFIILASLLGTLIGIVLREFF